jgi:hypothetical protein
VALVGASTALATPALAVAGAIVGWHRIVSAYGKGITIASTVLVGGGIVSLVYQVILPFLAKHGDMLAPFALANGLAAAACYAALELRFGLQGMAAQANLASWASRLLGGSSLVAALPVSVPFGGVVVGLLAGLFAPLLWPLTIRMCWPDELRTAALRGGTTAPLVDLYFSWCLPAAVPVSLLAGYALHLSLAGVIFGSPTAPPWQRTALPLLIVLSVAAVGYSSLCVPALSECFWYERLDPQTGARYSFNVRTGLSSSSVSKALDASETRALLEALHELQTPLLSRLRNAWRGSSGEAAPDTGRPSAHLKVRVDCVQPDLPLIDASAHADLVLALDFLARAQVLPVRGAASPPAVPAPYEKEEGQNEASKEDPTLQLKALHAAARSQLGVDLEELLRCARAAVGTSRRIRLHASAPPGGESDRGRAHRLARREDGMALLRRVREHAEEAVPVGADGSDAGGRGGSWLPHGWTVTSRDHGQRRRATVLVSNLMHNLSAIEEVLVSAAGAAGDDLASAQGASAGYFDRDADVFVKARDGEAQARRRAERRRQVRAAIVKVTRITAAVLVLWYLVSRSRN